MEIKGWKYYNHAAIPSTAPHEEPNVKPIEDKSIWNIEGKSAPLLARWTADFDCGHETNWWYVIKDRPFDIAELKAKRRYEVNKGKKNFEVKEIVATDFTEKLLEVTLAAYSSWPEKYRPQIEKENFISSVKKWKWYKVLGIFNIEDKTLCGYALLSKQGRCVEFNVLRVNPKYERMGINAAAVAAILDMHEEFLNNGGYICDGARSIAHETAFQDYLEKYFGFRKAYCKLNIKYNPKIKWIIKLLYPIRNILLKFDNIGKVHQINAVLKMEKINRMKG